MVQEARSLIKIFDTEHAHILSHLAGLSKNFKEISREMEDAGDCSPATASPLTKALGSLSTSLHYHFSREELLYGTLQATLGPDPGMIQALEDEHDHARGDLSQLEMLTKQFETGIRQRATWPGAPAVDGIAGEIARLVADLTERIANHIRKEDRAIFPMIEDMVSSRALGELKEELRSVEPAAYPDRPVLDFQDSYNQDRLARVTEAYVALQPGDTLVLRDDQSLQPLYYQMMMRWEGEFIWSCHEESPGRWTAGIRKVSQKKKTA